MSDAPPHFGTMLVLLDADGAFEAIGFAGADIVAVDDEIIEVLAEREQRKRSGSKNAPCVERHPIEASDARRRAAVTGRARPFPAKRCLCPWRQRVAERQCGDAGAVFRARRARCRGRQAILPRWTPESAAWPIPAKVATRRG